MRVAVVGLGAVGSRVARRLADVEGIERVVVHGSTSGEAQRLAGLLARDVVVAGGADVGADVDVVVISAPCGLHVDLADRVLRAGAHVVSVSDSVADVSGLLRLDEPARHAERCVVIGAGFAPGMSCLLARHLGAELDEVTEIHVAKRGTGGPACARQHHDALRSEAVDWRDGWQRRAGGSGRELCWFPSPIDGHDCYRAALADTFLLQPHFESASRITARMSATRRDRMTMHVPMLRKPHPEGLDGAIRVEVRGRVGRRSTVDVAGVVQRPAVAAAIVATAVVGRLDKGAFDPGATGLGGTRGPELLVECATQGLTVQRFDGHSV